MTWVYLVLAGIMEWGWPFGFKSAYSEEEALHIRPSLAVVACMAESGGLLILSLRAIPMGSAYAVWTGIGAVGTFLIGVLFFKEPAEVMRFVCVGMIIAGIVGLKLVSD